MLSIANSEAIRLNLQKHFLWESDGKLDSYHIMEPESNGVLRGDCDDYAATLLYRLSRGRMKTFWWSLVTRKAKFWMVRDPRGGLHITLEIKGVGHTDNQKSRWTPTEDMHKTLYRVPVPMVALKMLIGKFDRT